MAEIANCADAIREFLPVLDKSFVPGNTTVLILKRSLTFHCVEAYVEIENLLSRVEASLALFVTDLRRHTADVDRLLGAYEAMITSVSDGLIELNSKVTQLEAQSTAV